MPGGFYTTWRILHYMLYNENKVLADSIYLFYICGKFNISGISISRSSQAAGPAGASEAVYFKHAILIIASLLQLLSQIVH